MLRWKSGHRRKYRIQNGEICLKVCVASIDAKKRESHLRQFGQVQIRTINAPVRSDLIQVKGTKKCRETLKRILVVKKTCKLRK